MLRSVLGTLTGWNLVLDEETFVFWTLEVQQVVCSVPQSLGAVNLGGDVSRWWTTFYLLFSFVIFQSPFMLSSLFSLKFEVFPICLCFQGLCTLLLKMFYSFLVSTSSFLYHIERHPENMWCTSSCFTEGIRFLLLLYWSIETVKYK